MKKAILDTDTVSMFLKGNEHVASKIKSHLDTHGPVSLSVITYYEILNGLLYKDANKQLSVFERFVKLNKVISLNVEAADAAAKIEAVLRVKGKVIGHTDTLIAGAAIAAGLQLITNNTEHFKRVKDLDIANWTK
jgi:predicted nucleic acid-binding protein